MEGRTIDRLFPSPAWLFSERKQNCDLAFCQAILLFLWKKQLLTEKKNMFLKTTKLLTSYENIRYKSACLSQILPTLKHTLVHDHKQQLATFPMGSLFVLWTQVVFVLDELVIEYQWCTCSPILQACISLSLSFLSLFLSAHRHFRCHFWSLGRYDGL